MSDASPPPNEDERLEQAAARLKPMQEAAGVRVADDLAVTAPTIYVGRGKTRPTPQDLTRSLVDLLRGRGLYRRGRDIVTIDEERGECELMKPHTFVTSIKHVFGITPICGYETDAKTGKQRAVESDVTVDQAKIVLASQELRAKVPEIEHVNLVPLPVLRDTLDERGKPERKGFRKIELLQPGHDAATKTFTCRNGVHIDEKLDAGEAADWLFKILRTFDWSDKDERGQSNRMAAHVAFMLSVFARHLYAGKAPLFLYNSNLEGSGKTSLVNMGLLPVFRVVGSDTIDPMDRKEVSNILNTRASAGSHYLWGDEMPERCELRDQNIARWATMKTWEFRPMGQNKEIGKASIEKMITVFTANGATVNRNLNRRIVHVDLFPRVMAREKIHAADTIFLTDEWFADEDNLNKVLSAMWAMIKAWDDADRPIPRNEQGQPVDRWLESFEGWSKVIPQIVEYAGLGRPLVPFEAPGAGDDNTRNMKLLFAGLIEEHCTEERDGAKVLVDHREVTMKEIVACARKRGLFLDRLGSIDDILTELEGKKNHKWKPAPLRDYLKRPVLDEEEKPVMGEPDDEQKREQAAGYLGEALGSTWGKFFRKLALDGQWFPTPSGAVYQFGDRGSSKQSKFAISRVGAVKK